MILKYSSTDIHSWLQSFGDLKISVLKNCDVVRKSPATSKAIPVHGSCHKSKNRVSGFFIRWECLYRTIKQSVMNKDCPEAIFSGQSFKVLEH